MIKNNTTFVLLPAYNEGLNLRQLIENLINFFEIKELKFQIVICDDGSTDNTNDAAKFYSNKDKRITLLEHKLNRGLGETIRTLFEFAAQNTNANDYIIRMDGDSTHEPEFISQIQQKLDLEFDVVIASRFIDDGSQLGVPNYRKFLSLIANRILWLMFPIKPRIKEYTSGYRGYSARIIQKAVLIYGNDFIQLKNFGFSCTIEKLLKLHLLGAKITEIPFTLRYDKKQNESKMVTNITTFGYFIILFLYHWPRTGWKYRYTTSGSIKKFN